MGLKLKELKREYYSYIRIRKLELYLQLFKEYAKGYIFIRTEFESYYEFIVFVSFNIYVKISEPHSGCGIFSTFISLL